MILTRPPTPEEIKKAEKPSQEAINKAASDLILRLMLEVEELKARDKP